MTQVKVAVLIRLSFGMQISLFSVYTELQKSAREWGIIHNKSQRKYKNKRRIGQRPPEDVAIYS